MANGYPANRNRNVAKYTPAINAVTGYNPNEVKKYVGRAGKAPKYKIPKTPKTSGYGWGP